MTRNASLIILSLYLAPCCTNAQASSHDALKTDTARSNTVKTTLSKIKVPPELEKGKSMTCKLTTPELMKRKTTIIAGIKKLIIEKKEKANGFAYKFGGTDKNITLLTDFIKTERQCCDFFNFSLAVNNDNSVWLDITGARGVKTFIKTELGL